jgi:hypothetical protein
MVTFAEEAKEEIIVPVLSTTLSKEFWFSPIKDLEIDLLANIQAFII